MKRKQIKKSEPIRCVLDTENDAAEISLDENVTREAMHPADQFERFRELADNRGWGAEEIAARFGVSAHVVRQRLRLGAVSPKLMQVYRDGGLSLDQLMAFAITEDHDRQEQVFDNLSWNREPATIRRDLTKANVEATERRARFVGADAYLEAGGTIIRDLFTEDRGGYFEDAVLLDRLVSIPMPQLDAIVCDHIENRLLQPERLEEILASILDRREERADRHREHIAELNRRAAETELRLKRLYEAIEAGVADLNDPALKERVVALRALRDQAQVDSERAQAMLESSGSMAVTPAVLRKFPTTARRRFRQEGGVCRRDHLRAAQRVEVGEGPFASWDRSANCCAPLLRSLAGKRRETECPLWD